MHRDSRHLAASAARQIGEAMTAGKTAIGLAGGSTPRATYEVLRSMHLPWERTRLWLSDERWVPPDHPDSNGRMAVETLTDHVPASLLRPPWGDDPDRAARNYETLLRAELTAERRNIVMLGMGTDGHTASLFPGTAALDAPVDRWYVHNWVPQLESHRLTATRALIEAADLVMVLVAGAGKAAVLAEVLEGPPGRYPIQFVRDLDSAWLVDEAAAGCLTAITIE